ncbi:MAG TPA: hypothetical protein VGG37_02815 [Opitutaceae bacterium]|jgi:hypothetical protein
MRAAALMAGALLGASGCSSPHHAQRPPPPPPSAAPAGLPGRIEIPASYRLMLLDGRLCLVREADPQSLAAPPASLRVVTGEVERGELAYQPGLLPQELAAEVAANRESSQRMDNALRSVLERSRELSGRAEGLQAEAERLGGELAQARERITALEAAARAARAPVTEAPTK